MTEEIVAGLARFSYLRVISRSSTLRYAGETADGRAVGKELGARYVLDGSLRQAGARLRIAVQLADTGTGAQLWSESYDQDFRPDAVFEVQDALVPRIVSTVGDMHGVLPRSMSDALRHRAPDSLSPREALLRSFGYFERVTPEDLAASRSALETAVRKDPAFPDAWAMLGLLNVQDYAQGFGLQANSLQSGFDAARRAVDLAPTSPLAHFALAQALFFRKELEKFRHEAERTVSLNPMDGSSLALVGEMLGHSGEWERALALTRRARQLNPHHPGWYWYVDFYDAYRRRDYRAARDVALKFGATNHWGAHLLMAAACAQLGDREKAAEAVREALRLRPRVAETFADDARKWFEPGFAAQLIDGLRKAGLDVPAAEGPAPPAKAPAVSPPASAPNRKPWIAIAALVVLAAAIWIVRSRTVASRAPETAPAPGVIRSLAVLPLDNYSGDPSQDYFAEGMTDELTSQLANISRLRVISRGSAMQFKGKSRPPTPEIAKKLGVDAVVEGSVIRSGDKVRITAQLIDARSDRHLWSKSFERSSKDVLALQDELASSIAREIHVSLTPAEETRLAKAPSVNPDAYDAYLKGRYFFNRPSDENLSKAIAQFEEVNKLDPTFAPAFSGLSDAYLWAGYNEGVIPNAEGGPKAKAAAEAAIRLDDASAEAHASLATYLGWYAHDWSGSEASYRRAFALNPNYSFAHDQFGILLALQGRLDEAVAEGQRAAELDPLSPQIPLDASMAFAFRGDHEAARRLARRATDLDPTFFFPPFMEGWIDIQAGKPNDAIPLFEKAKALEGPPFVIAWLGYAHGVTGDRARATAALDALKTTSLKGYVPPFNLAIVNLGLGDRERALAFLEQAYSNNSQWMPYLRGDRTFDPLRSEPRFQALLKKLGFAK